MEIYVLMGQRRCVYPGEHGPEAIDCMSGPEYSDNPDYLNDMRKKLIDSGEYQSIEVIMLSVDRAEVDRRLFPASNPVTAVCK